MTPDELRALADALEPMARAPRFEDFDVPAFCAWVRAQADAQPTPAVPQDEPRVVASFYTEDAELVGTTHAPIKRVEVEDDGTLHVFIDHWPQAESKREPLSDEWLARKAFLLGIPLWTLTVIVRAVECAHEIGGSDD